MSDLYQAAVTCKFFANYDNLFSFTAGFDAFVRAFTFKNLERFSNINTCNNPNGIHSIACVENKIIIATPHIQPGTVIVSSFLDHKASTFSNGVVINAHKG